MIFLNPRGSNLIYDQILLVSILLGLPDYQYFTISSPWDAVDSRITHIHTAPFFKKFSISLIFSVLQLPFLWHVEKKRAVPCQLCGMGIWTVIIFTEKKKRILSIFMTLFPPMPYSWQKVPKRAPVLVISDSSKRKRKVNGKLFHDLSTNT